MDAAFTGRADETVESLLGALHDHGTGLSDANDARDEPKRSAYLKGISILSRALAEYTQMLLDTPSEPFQLRALGGKSGRR